jgi:hypothetical protein
LRRLEELAREEKVTLEVSLYGGAVFTLVYGSREATKDVDAVVRPSEIAVTLAVRVAKEHYGAAHLVSFSYPLEIFASVETTSCLRVPNEEAPRGRSRGGRMPTRER